MRLPALLLAATFLSLPLAGCIDQVGEAFKVALGDEGPGGARAPIVRLVDMQLTEETFATLDQLDDFEDVLAALVQVRFEYQHASADAPAANVRARYTDRDGLARERALSEFTSRATLRSGDVVTIPAVFPTSGLTITQDGSTLASREGRLLDWFTADGYPLPMAASKAGTTRWHIEAGGSFDAEADGATFTTMREECDHNGCEEVAEQVNVEKFFISLAGSQSGSLSASFSHEGGQSILRFAVDGTAEGSLDLRFEAEVDGSSIRSNGTASGSLNGQGLVDFRFGPDRDLDAVGTEGSVTADATYYGRSEEDGVVEIEDSSEREHPLYVQSMPYTEEILDLDPRNAESLLVNILTDLWGVDLAVGDRIDMHLNFSPGPAVAEVDLTYQVAVTERGQRTAAGRTVPTLRVTETLQSTRGLGLGAIAGERIETTYWLHAETYVPVFSQFEYTRTFDRAALVKQLDEWVEVMGEMGGEMDYSLPPGSTLSLTMRGLVRMEQHDTDFSMPGLLAINGLRMVSMFGAGAMGMYMAAPAWVGDDDHEAFPPHEEMQTPRISFAVDDPAGTMTVVRVDHGVMWNQLAADGHPDLRWALNDDATAESPYVWAEPVGYADVLAGDTLSFCMDVAEETEINIIHRPTFTLIYSRSFAELPVCV
jgi:hypothetical protein